MHTSNEKHTEDNMVQPSDLWRVSFEITRTSIPEFEFWWEEAWHPEFYAMGYLTADKNPDITVDLHIDQMPAENVLERLEEQLAHLNIKGVRISQEANKDWVSETQKNFPPLSVGPIYVHGSHIARPQASGRIVLQIDANQAFGTGRHETTHLCLEAMLDLKKKEHPKNCLDMGCGTGILAFVAARLWPNANVVAADNDPIAIMISRTNAEQNYLSNRIRQLVSNGFSAPLIRRTAPYDLILANILAGPLLGMAYDVARYLTPGGFFIASGILQSQEQEVAAKYRHFGLVLAEVYRLGDWSALVFQAACDTNR